METCQQMSITLPIEMAAIVKVKAKVAAADHGSESEVSGPPERAIWAEQVRRPMAAKRQRTGIETP